MPSEQMGNKPGSDGGLDTRLNMRPIGYRGWWLWSSAVLVTLLLILGLVSVLFLTQRNNVSIRQLQEVPIGSAVTLLGVVTYADPAEKRFWIQDETGAVAIDQNPQSYGLRAGQSVRVEATKKKPYDASTGPNSVGLTGITVHNLSSPIKLPSPQTASLRALPAQDKAGIRVQVVGVVHYVTRDDLGRVQLILGESGQEVPVTLSQPETNTSRWVDAKVRVFGVAAALYINGTLVDRHIWVQNSNDIEVEKDPTERTPVVTIRELYHNATARDEHRVRLRGRIAAQLGATSVLVEDRWGAVACRLEKAQALAVGTPVEVVGYPNVEGLQIDLSYSVVTPISTREVDEAGQGELLPALTTVASIRELSVEQASAALPVRVSGVVTYHDADWRALFLQDPSGAIYVKYSGTPVQLATGQRVEVTGVTNPGDYAPVIVAPKLRVLGTAALPVPVTLTARDAASGILDCVYVEVEGVIHPLDFTMANHLSFDLYSSFGRLRVFAGPEYTAPQSLRGLEDATVRIRGVFAPVFNSRRQMVGYQLSVSSPDKIRVLLRPLADPFRQSAVPVARLMTYLPHADVNHRIKVKGSVTMVGRTFLYIQDGSGGLEVRSEVQRDYPSLQIGDVVEAVGYASAEGGYSPVLTDAMVRRAQDVLPVAPKTVIAESAAQGQCDSQLVTVDGRLLSVVDTLNEKNLVLQAGMRTFNASLDTVDSAPSLSELKEGSVLRLTGVCSVQVNPNKLYHLLLNQEPLGFRILLRSARDVSVLKQASWWTGRHALFVLGLFSIAILAALGQVTILRRRVRRQTTALRKAKAKAQAISDLVGTMQEVTEQEDFAARVSVRGSDEIALLGTEFNKMLSELQKRDRAKREAETKLQLQALTDELTGLPNRRLLSDRLTQTLALARRERRSVALLYVDLDGFKLVNDSLGHTVGDLLLGKVASRLRSRIRESDTLARLGGDEFTVVLTSIHAKEDAEMVARNLLEVLAKRFVIEKHEITISASIGISFFPDDATDAVRLLQQADSAMYAAKRNGKSQIARFTAELGSMVRERMNLEVQLRRAIAHGDIQVHYQPEFDVASRRLIRFEALARWTHATLGSIPPTRFIPIAEESGLITPLGAYIMERACTEAVKWQSISPDPIQIAVNVSSLQFAREAFVEEVAEILRHTGLPAHLLQIELTESIMLSGATRAGETMKNLRALGVSLAIDDFGTGYSCLSYLPKLAFDALKIDRSFVSDLESRPETKAMVHSLVTLAHNLNMRVIVEGVETPQQLEMIQEFGSNEVQGFLLGRPTPDPESLLRTAQNGMEFRFGPVRLETPRERSTK